MADEAGGRVEAHLRRIDAALAREDARARRRLDREERRAHRHAGRDDSAQGVVMLIAAAAIAVYGFIHPQMWWLLFVALGLGTRGAQQLRKVRVEREVAPPQGERPALEAPSSADPDAQGRRERLARIDALATQLLSELASAPSAMREVVQRPEQTVTGLQKGCHALTERQEQLAALVRPEDDARLAREQEALTAKRDAQTDEVTREKLSQALAALATQQRERAQMKTQLGRLEAEQTRILYTLEGLLAQVRRAKTAQGTAAELASSALREGATRLGDELAAVADALEEVSQVSPVEPISDERPGAAGGQRERS